MRVQIERWFLIILLAVNTLSGAPGWLRQGGIGLPALVGGFLLATVLIVFLLKSSARAAGVIAVLAGLVVGFGVLRHFLIGQIFPGHAPPSPVWLLSPLIEAVCAVDLWSTWRKRPNPAATPAR